MPVRTSFLTKSALCAALTAALAWVVFPLPFSTVPISGQTLGVMITGILLPPRWAGLSMLVYVLLGVIGLPVFAGGSAGLGVLAGPTGGYIWSFIPSALFIAWALNRPDQRRRWQFLALFVGGIVLIYIPGMLQLIVYTRTSLKTAFVIGALPFLLGDGLKLLFCWWLLQHPGFRDWRSTP